MPTHSRPSKLRALLWQQKASLRSYALLAIIGGFSLGVAAFYDGFNALGVMVWALSLLIIGSTTFYSDSVRKRSRFLSDRGISSTLIWLTRVGPALLATLLVLATILVPMVVLEFTGAGLIGKSMLSGQVINLFCIGLAVFSLSQLVSQWSPRPTLTFFAGPVFVGIAAIILAMLFEFYTRATAALLLSTVVLLFASWRLAPKWMAGETDRGYVAPFLGYIAVALFLPYITVLGTRWITTPSERTQWRDQMMSMKLPVIEESGADRITILDPSSNWQTGHMAAKLFLQEDREERIAKELAATHVLGGYTSLKELLVMVVSPPDDDLEFYVDYMSQNFGAYEYISVFPASQEYSEQRKSQFDAARVLLKWSRFARETAANNDTTFIVLNNVAEQADLIVGRLLNRYVDAEGMTEELAELVKQLPDANLIKQSRRNSLIRSFRSYQSSGFWQRFAGQLTHKPTPFWLAIERTRADRYVDELCKYILDQWESGRNFKSADALGQLQKLEHEAYLRVASENESRWKNIELSVRLMTTVEVDERLTTLRTKLAQIQTRNSSE